MSNILEQPFNIRNPFFSTFGDVFSRIAMTQVFLHSIQKSRRQNQYTDQRAAIVINVQLMWSTGSLQL